MKQKGKEKPKKEPKHKEIDLEELREQTESLRAEKDEVFEKLQRVSADYANFQKRVPKQIADSISYEKEKIIKTLLPVLDNFEHTLQNAHSAENVETIAKGIQIIYDQILDILKSHGVERIKALGESFDPALHEAMMQKAEANSKENIVLEEFQKGYKLNDRVIRPSKVVVNKLPAEQAAQQEEQDQQQPQTQEVDLQQQQTDESQTTDTE